MAKNLLPALGVLGAIAFIPAAGLTPDPPAPKPPPAVGVPSVANS